MAVATPRVDADAARAAEIAELGRAFKQVFRALIRLRGRDTHLAEGELSHAQCELLFELEQRGELSAGQLAAAAQLAPATVTQMLEHLAQSGHVERARDTHDRRVVRSRLTARGRREIEAKRARFRERWEQALADVGPADLRAATDVLSRLQAVFADVAETAADGSGCAADTPEPSASRGSRGRSKGASRTPV